MTTSPFTRADNARLGRFKVARNAPQPLLETSYSIYWPATEWKSLNVEAMVDRDWAHGKFSFLHWIWGDRMKRDTANGTGLEGGWLNGRFSSYPFPMINVDQGGDIRGSRFNYTSMEKANGNFVARCMDTLGYTDAEISANAYWQASGWDISEFISIDVYNADPTTYFNTSSGTIGNPTELWVCVDKPWRAQARICDIPHHDDHERGILIDAEWQDGRTGAEATALIEHVCNLAHAKGFVVSVWPNSLTNTGALYSGFTATSIPLIHATADYLSILAYEDGEADGIVFADELVEQWNLLGPLADPAKVMLTYSLGDPGTLDTDLNDARAVRQFAEDRGIPLLGIWRNYQQPSGVPEDPHIREIATLLFGDDMVRPLATEMVI